VEGNPSTLALYENSWSKIRGQNSWSGGCEKIDFADFVGV
jgi:hypothetical protein